MGMFSGFEPNSDAENNGVALDYGSFRVVVRRAGGTNKSYEKIVEQLVHPYRRAIKTGTLTDDVALDILYKTYARAVIADWLVPDGEKADGSTKWKSGIEDISTGEIVKPSEAHIISVLRQYPDLFADIKEAATSIKTFQAEDDEAAVKN